MMRNDPAGFAHTTTDVADAGQRLDATRLRA